MPDEPMDWRDTNAAWRSMESLRTRIEEVLRHPAKLKIVHGPPGAAMNSIIVRKLRATIGD